MLVCVYVCALIQRPRGRPLAYLLSAYLLSAYLLAYLLAASRPSSGIPAVRRASMCVRLYSASTSYGGLKAFRPC